MRRLLLPLLLLAASSAAAQTWHAGAIGDPAMTILANEWLAHMKDSVINERAYCVSSARRITLKDDKNTAVYIVDGVQRPVSVEGASEYGIKRVMCGPGTFALIHTHGVGDCNPSRTDYRALRRSGQPFAVVQCGVVHHRFYYPHEYRPALLSTPAFFGLLGGAVALNAFLPLDRDAGGYHDAWLANDKFVHFAAAGMLTGLATDAGVRPSVAAVGVCVAGAAFEATQGWASEKDVAVNCAGAGLVALWKALWR